MNQPTMCPAKVAYPMYRGTPEWQLIRLNPPPVPEHAVQLMAARAVPGEQNQRAMAWYRRGGYWSTDMQGYDMLDFEPNWWGPLPFDPPWPPPEDFYAHP